MKVTASFLLLLIMICFSSVAVLQAESMHIELQDTTAIEIPKTVHQAVAYLNDFLSEEELAYIRESEEQEFVGNALTSSGLGSWIINEWDLWRPNPLNVYFNRNEISNPPEMAEVILTSFHRFLNQRPMHINDQIKEIRAFWEKQEEYLEEQR